MLKAISLSLFVLFVYTTTSCGSYGYYQRATPTSTPFPTPDNRLTVGEYWQEDNVWLVLDEVKFQPDGYVIVALVLENQTGDTLLFSWSPRSFNLVDNLGNRYKYWADKNSSGDKVLNSSQSYRFDNSDRDPGLGINFDGEKKFFNAAVTELTFSVNDLSKFNKVEWRIPVPH